MTNKETQAQKKPLSMEEFAERIQNLNELQMVKLRTYACINLAMTSNVPYDTKADVIKKSIGALGHVYKTVLMTTFAEVIGKELPKPEEVNLEALRLFTGKMAVAANTFLELAEKHHDKAIIENAHLRNIVDMIMKDNPPNSKEQPDGTKST